MTTLRAVLEEAVAELDEVEAVASADAVEWRRSGRPFAAFAGDGAGFRLDPLVARAALRTPDTHASPRGADWVRFNPVVLDDHGIDRAEAWLASAWRRAGD